jgi:hypothetical protein
VDSKSVDVIFQRSERWTAKQETLYFNVLVSDLICRGGGSVGGATSCRVYTPLCSRLHLHFKTAPANEVTKLKWKDVGLYFSLFFSLSNQMLGEYVKVGHERFLPHPIQFIIHWAVYHSTLYSLSSY